MRSGSSGDLGEGMNPGRGRTGELARGQVARSARIALSGLAALVLANCGAADKFGARVDPRYGVASTPRKVSRS